MNIKLDPWKEPVHVRGPKTSTPLVKRVGMIPAGIFIAEKLQFLLFSKTQYEFLKYKCSVLTGA